MGIIILFLYSTQRIEYNISCTKYSILVLFPFLDYFPLNNCNNFRRLSTYSIHHNKTHNHLFMRGLPHYPITHADWPGRRDTDIVKSYLEAQSLRT